jgi:hypothetical protein
LSSPPRRNIPSPFSSTLLPPLSSCHRYSAQHRQPSKVGKIPVNPVVFNGADNPNEEITSFEPIGVGQTLLQLTSPGFSNSASEVTVTVTK